MKQAHTSRATKKTVLPCAMPCAGKHKVPSASLGCKGRNFKTYWNGHNEDYDPDVELRIYKTKNSSSYNVYEAGKHGPYPFREYHELTPEGTDVSGMLWVGVVLDIVEK